MNIGDQIRAAQARKVMLGIGFPCNYGVVPSAFFKSVMLMKKPDYEFILTDEGDIANMRNQIVETALAAECTHLLMMDTDMLYHEDTIPRLLSHDLQIVGALCYRRKPPFDPLMFKGQPGDYHSIDEWNEELVEVDATGTGCLMFNMDVFRYMPAPWFKFRYHDDGKVIGEDIGFCHDLRQAGNKIFVDTTIPASHLTTMEVTDETYRWYKAVVTRQLRGRKVA
jgi:hypothetical protein